MATLKEPADRLPRETLEIERASDRRTSRVHALHVLDGTRVGVIFVVDGAEATAGRRESCELPLGDGGISRSHAVFVRSELGLYVTDLGSRNGTFVNGLRVTVGTLLCQGDTVALGGVRLRYGFEAEEEIRRLRSLYEAAVRDHLTGLYNRRFFEERFRAELAYAVRHRSELSLLMFDVDRFKQLNDSLGHGAGDVALGAVADVLQRGVRTEDMVARYGGEEFVVVARGAGLVGATALADRLRARVSELSIAYETHTISVTVSAGVAAFSPELSEGRRLLLAADAALFEAKRQGRNRVVAAPT